MKRHEKRRNERARKSCQRVRSKTAIFAGIVAILGMFGVLSLFGAGQMVAVAGGVDDSASLLSMLGIAGFLPVMFGPVAMTDTLKALREKCGKVQAEMGTIKGQVEAAAAKGDDGKDEYETAMRAYDAKKAEMKALTDQLEAAVAEAREQKRLAGLYSDTEALTATDAPDVSLAGGGGEPEGSKGLNPEPIDPEKKEGELESLFFKYFRLGSMTKGGERIQMSDREVAAMQPANKDLLSRVSDGEIAVKIPNRIYAKMLGCNVEAARKALPMASSDGADDGGRSYLYWGENDNRVHYLPPENPSFFDRVHKEPVSGGELILPILDQSVNNYGGVAVRRYTEGQAPDNTEADFKQKKIKCYPCGALTRITNVMLRRDRVGLEQFVTNMFGMAFRARINNEIINGTGDSGNMCLGLRNDDDVQTVARQTASKVQREDFIKMKHALNTAIRGQASYAIADSVEEHLEEQTVSQDGTTDRRGLFADVLVEGNTVRKLMTRAYFVGTDMPTLGTSGDVIFGAWMYYWLGIEQEAVISRSIHRYFDTGETGYRIDGLIGGKALLPDAFVELVGTGGS